MYYADYMLNRKTRAQTEAFLEGLHLVLKREQLCLFLPDEVQLLITGGLEDSLNVEDLRRHTLYHGYTDKDPYMEAFWGVVASLSQEDQEKFLAFVTGCNRPPLLGFRYLSPQFCVHRVLLEPGQQRLPTASTCMNMLKLPLYGGPDPAARLREALIYAIQSGAGFNLE